MKNLFLLFLAITFISCGDSGKHILSGELSNPSGETVYLQDLNQENFPNIDSTILDESGNFSFSTPIPSYGFYNVVVGKNNFATLILNTGDKGISITGDARDLGKTYAVSGSDESNLFWEINQHEIASYEKRSAIRAKQDSIQQLFQYHLNQNKNQQSIDSLSASMEAEFNQLHENDQSLMTDYISYIKGFIDQHSNSLVSIYAVSRLRPPLEYISYYEKVSDALNEKAIESDQVKKYQTMVADMKKAMAEQMQREQAMAVNEANLAEGNAAPEFSGSTPDGNQIALSSLKGKIVLLDFWASWCKPCRIENPNVVKLYQKYSKKGFEILGVSLDETQDAWVKAIQQDGLTWKHCSDLKGWKSGIALKYNVNAIPATFLLDKEGKIIAKNLRGEALANKLKEVFGS